LKKVEHELTHVEREKQFFKEKISVRQSFFLLLINVKNHGINGRKIKDISKIAIIVVFMR